VSTTATRPKAKLGACSNCGRPDRLVRVAVVEKATDRHMTIELCAQCESSKFRACWLQYQRIEDPQLSLTGGEDTR
jgi:NMD protein affecting ribosome stability and mRNA decay